MADVETAGRMEAEAESPKLTRRIWPPWVRLLSLIPVYLFLWPIARVMEYTGNWRRMQARAMKRLEARRISYEPRPNDVLVCSYVKTGTNWTMHIAVQIAHRGRARFEHIHDLVPWLELPPERNRFTVPLTDERVWRSAPSGLRVIKTHLPLRKLGYSPQPRYIWVVRDPKDVFVSSYYFSRSIVLGPLMPSVKTWLNSYLSDAAMFGSWAEHLRGGWENRHRDNVLFLTFEEMKSDLRGVVSRIADFMGIALTAEELDAVVRQTSYEHMKSIGHKFDTIGLSPPWARPEGAMIRRGQRGSAGELISEADQRRIDDYWRGELKRLGCDFPYEEAFATARPRQADEQK